MTNQGNQIYHRAVPRWQTHNRHWCSQHVNWPIVNYAELKINKARVLDEIPWEILKLIGERKITTVHKIFNIVYKSDNYPDRDYASPSFNCPRRSSPENLKITDPSASWKKYKKCDIDISSWIQRARRPCGRRQGYSRHVGTCTELSKIYVNYNNWTT